MALGAAISAVGSLAGGLLSGGEGGTGPAAKKRRRYSALALFGSPEGWRRNPWDPEGKGYQAHFEEELAPWQQVGEEGLETFVEWIMDPSKYTKSPGFDWLREQTLEGINAEAVAKGQFGAPRLEALMKTAGGLASQDYRNRLSDVGQLVGLGKWATDEKLQNYLNLYSLWGQALGGGANMPSSGSQMGPAVGSALDTVGQAIYNKRRDKDFANTLVTLAKEIGKTSHN